MRLIVRTLPHRRDVACNVSTVIDLGWYAGEEKSFMCEKPGFPLVAGGSRCGMGLTQVCTDPPLHRRPDKVRAGALLLVGWW